jgi:hypothetical protein
MSTTVEIDSVSRNLIRAWNAPATDVPPGMKAAIDGVMSASDVTFKYILVTGYVAKVTNPRIHARCLQTGSSLSESYDARSVCHKAVVPFEKTKGNLFGLSNEPFVNKPARHAEHTQDNDQLRNKVGARFLHAALEAAQRGTPDQVFAGLAYILSRGKVRSESERVAEVSHEVSMPRVQKFCRDFLAEADGGVRLVAVWGAFVSLLTEDAKINVESPNASDQFSKTAGDVEVVYDKTVVSASECKQRPISTDDVNHGLRKAARSGVPEYLFVISAGFAAGQEAAVQAAIAEGNKLRDTALVNIFTELPWLVRSLNPKRRGQFGDVVVNLCREMRKYDSANAAADLWNSVTS